VSACSHTDRRRLIVCSHIVEEGEPIHSVYHEDDGEWQVVCEHGAHNSAAEGRVVCFGCFRNRHPEIEGISDLYRGGRATAIKSEPGRWWVEPIETNGSA
jgi:hypothetical protein